MRNTAHGLGGMAGNRVRLCVQCRHAERARSGSMYCKAPTSTIDLVTGTVANKLCYTERKEDGACGPAGINWERA